MKKGQCSQSKNSLQNGKPFCDCKRCDDNKCPNVLQKLGVSLNDKRALRGKGLVQKKSSKGIFRRKSKCDVVEEPPEPRNSLLDMLNPDRACGCEVMARALHSNIHMNIGTLISEKRIENAHKEEAASHSKDQSNDDPKKDQSVINK